MMKCHDHAGHGSHSNGSHGVVKGGIITTGLHMGKVLIKQAGKHPALLVGIGFVAGFYIHKHRSQIIDSVTQVTEKGVKLVGK